MLKNKRIYFNLEKVSEGEIKLQTSFEKDEEKNVYLMGFASTPDVNSYGFIVENSAIVNAWLECKKTGKNIAVYEKHDMPVGKVVSCEEMSGKILVVLEIPKSGNDRLLSVYEQGIYVGLSVGGWRLDGEWDDNEEIFHVTEYYWYEVSLTDVPSNENAVLLEGIQKPIKIKKDDIKKMLLEKVTESIRGIK